jgi:chemotaxis protein CheX
MTAAEKISTPPAEIKVRMALIVEDNQEFNNIMRDFLTPLGFQVKQCYDGMQASGWVRNTKFDLIVLDIRIPSVNGLQVAAIARASAENRNSNIYIITGEMDPILRTKAEGLKIRNFLTKPVDFPALEASLKAQFAKSERKVTYDVRVINSFIEAAAEVYEFYFQEKPQRGKVQVRAHGQPEKGFCTGLIALTGDGFVGSMGLSMTAPFIKKLAITLFQGMEVKFDNEFVSDLTGEMCNQILGKVKLNFAKLGIKVTIGLPEVIMGKNHIIQHKVSNPVICLAMGRDKMVFELQFVLSQQDVKVDETKQADVPPASVLMFE